MPDFRDLVEGVGRGVDAAGVLVIAAGLVFVTLAALPTLRSQPSDAAYAGYRRGVGKVILLGLELLVAADIIRTVAVQPTLAGVAVLGVIVLVRTFLSFSLEVELYGRWPWQRGQEGTGVAAASSGTSARAGEGRASATSAGSGSLSRPPDQK